MRRFTRGFAHRSSAVESWLDAFQDALSGDAQKLPAVFSADAFWRDMLAFTWTIRTVEGRGEIAAALGATAPPTQARAWRVVDGPTPAMEAEAWLAFETDAGSGTAHVRLDGLMSMTAVLIGMWESLVAMSSSCGRRGMHRVWGAGMCATARARVQGGHLVAGVGRGACDARN